MSEPLQITPYRLASRYLTIREFPGAEDHPLIQWWLLLAGLGRHQHDETPWCGSFVGGIAWELELPRPVFPARARSWLTVGTPVSLEEAEIGFDIMILSRGGPGQPGPEVIDAPGHVGFYSGLDDSGVWLLGGNQGDAITKAAFSTDRVLGGRRLR